MSTVRSFRLAKLKPGSSFVRQIALLMSGTAFAQALGVLTAPVISRLFRPEDFGILTFYVSLLSLIGTVAGGKYEIAVVLPKEEKLAANLLVLSMAIAACYSLAGAALLAAMGETVAAWGDVPYAAWWIAVLPMSILAAGLYQSLNYWSTRQKTYKRQSISQVLRQTAVSTSQIGSGLGALGSAGLVLGQFAGQLMATSALAWQTWRDDGRRILAALRWKLLLQCMKEYRHFPLFNAPQTLVNAFSVQSATFLLAAWFGSWAVGLYGIAIRLMQMPLNLIGQSIRQVYLKRAADIHQQGGSLFPLLVKSTAGLAAIGVVPLAVVAAWGPQLFAYVLGEQWRAAGDFARWIMVWQFFAFINPPAMVSAQVLGIQKWTLLLESAGLILRVAGLWAGYRYWGSEEASIALFSLAGAGIQIGTIGTLAWMVRRRKQPNVQGGSMA